MMMNNVIKFTIAVPLALVAFFVVGLPAPEAHEHVYTDCYEKSCKPFNDAIEQGTCHGSGEGGCSQMALALLGCDQSCKRKQKKSELCKASIKVKNDSKKQIRTVRVGVYDIRAKKWRHENIRNKTLDPGESHTERANLPGIRGESFKINLHYKKRKGKLFKWGVKTAKSPIKRKQSCSNGDVIVIKIKK